MIARLWTESFDLIEANDQQVCEACKTKRIERHLWPHAREIAKAQSVQLKLTPLLPWR